MPSAGPGTLLFHLDMSLKNVLSGSRIWLGPRASWGCLAWGLRLKGLGLEA